MQEITTSIQSTMHESAQRRAGRSGRKKSASARALRTARAASAHYLRPGVRQRWNWDSLRRPHPSTSTWMSSMYQFHPSNIDLKGMFGRPPSDSSSSGIALLNVLEESFFSNKIEESETALAHSEKPLMKSLSKVYTLHMLSVKVSYLLKVNV